MCGSGPSWWWEGRAVRWWRPSPLVIRYSSPLPPLPPHAPALRRTAPSVVRRFYGRRSGRGDRGGRRRIGGGRGRCWRSAWRPAVMTGAGLGRWARGPTTRGALRHLRRRHRCVPWRRSDGARRRQGGGGGSRSVRRFAGGRRRRSDGGIHASGDSQVGSGSRRAAIAMRLPPAGRNREVDKRTGRWRSSNTSEGPVLVTDARRCSLSLRRPASSVCCGGDRAAETRRRRRYYCRRCRRHWRHRRWRAQRAGEAAACR